MAGEWIKFDNSLPEKPETLAITAKMGWDDPDLTVGKLMRLFRWFDQHTTDGNAVGVTPTLLDRVLGVTGFTECVATVGWIVVTEDSISLANFDKHNGATAKSRAQGAKRAATHRSNASSNGESNADGVTRPSPREEKRREDKDNTPQPPTGGRQRRSDAADEPGGFGEFWSAYPRKVGKDAARKAFAKRKPDADLLAKMLAAVAVQAKSTQWQRDGGQYVPHPSTWLNEGRWNDGEGAAQGGDSESRPQWALQAGFENRWEAENERCYAHNAHLFRDGRRMEVPE
ncbi:hypothetical protein [Delftia tsuruhatensis]|uniref:hypothetical protein n=1 Tax=Delftia tsuruhatensis TaxID=180282 RepID=UPI002260CD19|nr:hypothetical protein [Delftia tsuruhatensis]MCX7504540.1 hypothetical protein [Delftia tsuruhatensis]